MAQSHHVVTPTAFIMGQINISGMSGRGFSTEARVIAKGKGSIGAKIIEIAKAHDIPIEENEVLAGALSNVEIGDEIPAELYKAVAEVLIFVLRLSGRIR